MRPALYFLVGAAVAVVAAGLWYSQERARIASGHAAELARLRTDWENEKSDLESSLAKARDQAWRMSPTPVTPTSRAGELLGRPTPAEIISQYRVLRIPPGNPAPVLRQAVHLLEELAQAGPPALPAIGEFLGRYEDADLETSFFQSGKGLRERMPLEFSLPPSLRFGLLDVVRRIGGTEGESILSQSLDRTGRGAEVAYLALALEQLAPGNHREKVLTIARALLAQPAASNPVSPIDRYHRDYLYAVLTWFNDGSFVSEAQAQLVRADSQVDRGALKYLQQSLGARALPIVEQAYQNPLLTNSAGKEPLARLALNFVGADSTANEFYQRAINDPILSRSHRKNLIEDLNQDGFSDTRNLTAEDLPLIQNRIALIEALAPGAMDDANAAAFKEAYKDLLNMRAKILNPPAAAAGQTTPGVPK